MSTDKKRPAFEEGNDSITATPSRPPLKKRFTGSFNIQPVVPPIITHDPEPPSQASTPTQAATPNQTTALNPTTAPTQSITPPQPPHKPFEFSGNLDNYTKEELLQHMRSIKDEVLQFENRYEGVKKKHLDKEAQESLIKLDWELIQSEMFLLAKLLIGGDLPQIPDLPSYKLTPEQQKDWNYRSQMVIKELGTKAITRLESWHQQQELIERKHRVEKDLVLKRVIVSDWLNSEIQELKVSHKQNQQVIDQLGRNLESIGQQSDIVKRNIQMVTTEIEAALERLEDTSQLLSASQKRQDRAQSKLVAALIYGGLGDMAERVESNPKEVTEESIEVTRKKESLDELQKTTSMTEQAIKSQLEENKQILIARDKEFENHKRDRQLLLREEERLLSMFTMGEDRLVETEYAKTLKLSIEHYRDRCYHLEQRRLDIERKMDKVSGTRQQLIEQSKSEKMAQGITMESEMRRLEGDLNRIRGQRDHFQLLVEEQKMKDGHEKENQEKIIAFANSSKLKIAALESRIEKLKASGSDSLVNELSEFNEINDKIKHLRILLSSLEMIEKRSVSSHSTASLKKILDTWRSDKLIQLYDSVKADAKKCTMMIEFLEKNESNLLQEIDRVAGIYSKLEEQQNKKVFDLTQKRDQALKLQAEKSKYAQTFSSLISAKEKQMAAVSSLRITNEKQQELIKQLEEKERALEYQVYEKEKEIRKLHKTIEEDRTDLEDINHLCEDYRISVDQNEIMLTELQKTLKDKTKLMDEENHLREQVEDSCQKMKKKWDKISQGDNPAEQQLIDECEELRALLKCSTCRQRFRTHILIRCMHTFCKNCIDARLETRQRRCPTCSEPFGANDVKNFYL